MFRSDFVDLLNEGKMLCFVGSGASIDAGVVSWSDLVTRVRSALPSAVAANVDNRRWDRAFSDKKYPTCLSLMETAAGRELIEQLTIAEIRRIQKPGAMLRILADWPFAAYVTTNYDSLIEEALREAGQLGWVPVGNSPNEVRKVAGDGQAFVWHVHGAAEGSRTDFGLVLTEANYEDFYLEQTPLTAQLRALLGHRRVVFVGFGFADAEVLRLLKVVGRLCSPARPAFAFLAGVDESDRDALLQKYNVDVIPYRVLDGSHKELVQVLQFYTSFVLRRRLRFGQALREVPAHDSETAGLLVYNELLRNRAHVSADVISALAKSRILSLLRFSGPLTLAQLRSELESKIGAMMGNTANASSEHFREQILAPTLAVLESENLITRLADTFSLAEGGDGLVNKHAATVSLMRSQFERSLRDRAGVALGGDGEVSTRVATAAAAFLLESIDKRSLGVALSWAQSKVDFQKYHLVGLLQALPEYMQQLRESSEALALVEVVVGLLSRPTDGEAQYIGTALQAKFGVNLLGYDPEALSARITGISQTLFLLDASTVIPMLASGCRQQGPGRALLGDLSQIGATAATTPLLLAEVAEHARYALKRLEQDPGLTVTALRVAEGKAGGRPNQFLEGFFCEVEAGHIAPNFPEYLRRILNGRSAADDESFAEVLRALGVLVLDLPSWQGFADHLFAERDELQQQIKDHRLARLTYRHDRQVKAEAEALITIEGIRKGLFSLPAKTLTDAYFVSNTTAIDRVSQQGRAITMKPAAVQQWLTALRSTTPAELAGLTSSLIGELAERGLNIIDRTRVSTIFGPLISASRAQLLGELEKHHEMMAAMYGESHLQAFADIGDLDVPVALSSYQAQRADYLEALLLKERRAKEALASGVGLDNKQKAEFELLKAKEKQRKLKSRSKQRALSSRPKKRH